MGSLKPVTPKQAFAQFIVEQMAGLGPVQAKAMFGGFGLYLQGLMFSLILDDTVYIKVDDASRERFESQGLEPFRYEAKGKVASLKYFQAPAEAYDDPSAMMAWARLGYEAAVRQHGQSGRTRRRSTVKP
ncbi:MAG: TfoX/Sxy family protein [Burkholderiales bacterium]|nr:TfoX/Sxy family protein [Burkholderiales bacterium]MDE2076181.1 TfoX/Sxy family protein [Burkholderiales bacterium]MDE2434098.1 TfoX/Sxy family protein [Burkholderiales bacterium]